MTDSAWERLTEAIDIKLGFDRHGREARPLEDRPDLTAQVEFFEFVKDGQTLRLERHTGPAIIDRKSHYSHRGGTANRIETIYNEREIAHTVHLLRKEGNDWVAVDLNELGL
ncbi:hypothetical protein EPO04_01430 [Patescibacteria group bacterium]|nr:MAG: hypothetical protein EPO04_01430 [Patescibacteria group bacterium]